MHTRTFHEFYVKVESYQKTHWQNIKEGAAEIIHLVEDSLSETAFEPDLLEIKCEETELTVTSKLSSHTRFSSEGDEDDDYELPNGAKNALGDGIDNNIKSEMDTPKNSIDLSRLTKIQQDARIAEFFSLKCNICTDNVQMKSWLEFRGHYRKVHNKKAYVKCCQIKFLTRVQLLKHLGCHIESNTGRDGLTQVSNDEEDAKIREFFNLTCYLCNDAQAPFETMPEFKKHFREIHNTTGYLHCCGKKFWLRAQLLAHIRYHTDPNNLRCKECGKTCKSKYSLQNHMTNHLALDARPHKCTQCRSSFATEAILRLHVRTQHTAVTGEAFGCDKCDKM